MALGMRRDTVSSTMGKSVLWTLQEAKGKEGRKEVRVTGESHQHPGAIVHPTHAALILPGLDGGHCTRGFPAMVQPAGHAVMGSWIAGNGNIEVNA